MRRFTLLIGLMAICLGIKAQQKAFRVIGYLRTQNIRDGQADQVDYSKVTHINIAFVNPDSLGNFETMPGLQVFADKMHTKHVKVLASIGGGLAPAYYADLLGDAKRPALIQKLVELTQLYNLDGIDV